MKEKKKTIWQIVNLETKKIKQVKPVEVFNHNTNAARRVARNSQWGSCVGGLGEEPPAAGGWGFRGKAPSRWRHGGLGAETLALENFAFFCKNNLTYGCFDKKIILLKRGLEIGSANMIKLVA